MAVTLNVEGIGVEKLEGGFERERGILFKVLDGLKSFWRGD